MPVNTREATEADKNEIALMMLKFQEHMETCNPNVWHITDHGRAGIPQRVDDMLRSMRKTFIAETNDSIVGFAHCHIERRVTYTPGTMGFFDMLYVKENHRRKGIASQLISRVCDYFTYEHVAEVNLRYVVGNKEAEALWSSLGLKPVLITANVHLKECKQKIFEKMK